MQKILAENMADIIALCRMHNVRSLVAFGSACTDQFNENSTVDLLVSLNPMDDGEDADTCFTLALPPTLPVISTYTVAAVPAAPLIIKPTEAYNT